VTWEVKCDYITLVAMVKSMEAQVVFSSILLVKEKGLRTGSTL